MNLLNHGVKKNIKNYLSKNFNVFKSGFVSLIAFGLIVASCSDNGEVIETENQLEDTLEVQLSAEIDEVDIVLGDLLIDAYEFQESGIADRNSQTRDIPDCVTITIVAQQGYRQVTLGFGTEGCIINGHLLKGQIIFDYTRDTENQEIMINYSLVNFYFDAKNIIGSRSILKELSNENGNPQFTHDLSIIVIWPNGVQASREGTKIREWVEGFGSGVFNDNVFEITGDWTATFVNGNTHAYDVLIPLRREVLCAYFVSGAFRAQRTNFAGIFDYGEGQCDNQALFTFNNGQEIEITLN